MAGYVPIDPILLGLDAMAERLHSAGSGPNAETPSTASALNASWLPSLPHPHISPSSPGSPASPSGAEPLVHPPRDAQGKPTIARQLYQQQLDTFTRKAPLKDALEELSVEHQKRAKYKKSGNLAQLKESLLTAWFPDSGPLPTIPLPLLTAPSIPRVPRGAIASSSPSSLPLLPPPEPEDESLPDGSSRIEIVPVAADPQEQEIIEHFEIPPEEAAGLLDGGEDDDEGQDEYVDVARQDESAEGNDEESADEEGTGDDDASEEDFESFKMRTRVDASKTFEQQRRKGGRITQKAMERLLEEFVQLALGRKWIKDGIVDEHFLLLYIRYNYERPQRSRRGLPITGTRVGASQQKKQFFGALRVRKQQEAKNPSLEQTRPCKSVYVWDLLKACMDAALQRIRSGEDPQDAPDIIANTFLNSISDETLARIGRGFLAHRELQSVVKGHFAWTWQNATGNRGDDVRALRLSELQPYEMLHPNKRDGIFTILGLQGAEKCGRRGMRTVINPSYSTIAAHKDAMWCPFGGLAFYMHYLFDVVGIIDRYKLDFAQNSSWRGIWLLNSRTSATVPFSEQSFHKLVSSAFDWAQFESHIKAHLARHLLGYRLERLGVENDEIQKLGWSRQEVYHDTYRPAFPKKAILAGAGFRADEPYDPVHTRVPVPAHFLEMLWPMAEETHASVEGKINLGGATNFWSMLMRLRPHFFQCAAIVFEQCPKSALFRLPALKHRDVRNWMSTTFLETFTLLKAQASDPVAMMRVENYTLQQSVEQLTHTINQMRLDNAEMSGMLRELLNRTTVLAAPTGFSSTRYHERANAIMSSTLTLPAPATTATAIPAPPPPVAASMAPSAPSTPQRIRAAYDDAGFYGPDSDRRAFVNPSPMAVDAPRQPTQVDLVLPHANAFYPKGQQNGILPPFLGEQTVTWTAVFSKIQNCDGLWSRWGPQKTLAQYKSVRELWEIWTEGELQVVDNVQTGRRPPLRDVEEQFRDKWRTGATKDETGKIRKSWQRFREIPEYIAKQASLGRSPKTIIAALESRRTDAKPHLTIAGLGDLLKEERTRAAKENQAAQGLVSEPSPLLPAFELDGEGGGSGSGSGEAVAAGTSRKKGRERAYGARRQPPQKKQKVGD